MPDINRHILHPGERDPERLDRRAELQEWDRDKAVQTADRDGLTLTEDHWHVITFLRRYYLDHGLPASSHVLSRTLDSVFADEGGKQYLHRLFPDGPVAQGARIAGLPVPFNAEDESFGSVQ